MSAPYTPGPWHVAGGTEVRGCRNIRVVCDTSIYQNDATAAADARLISAAPDLVEALLELLCDAEMMREPYRNEAVCERARAAISKAGVK